MSFLKKIIILILTVESRLIIRKYKPFIIAVTGSVGKTATKDAIYCALSSSGHVRKTEKNLNNEFGLPLTIIGVPTAYRSLSGWMKNIGAGATLFFTRKSKVKYPEILVLEIGADHPGDIKRVAKWLHPDISVITRVGDKPVHVEFFKSPAQVFEEKSALAYAVRSGGAVILFADEPKIVTLGKEIKKTFSDKKKLVSVVNFGLGEVASVRGLNYKVIYESGSQSQPGVLNRPVGFSFDLNIKINNEVSENKSVIVRNVIGQNFMYPVLAAVAVAKVKGIDVDTIIKNVSKYEAPKGRMNIVEGINDSILIDDTYNSSPDAVAGALEALKGLECSGRKIAVIGDMMELGKYSAEEHRQIGREVVGSVNRLITIGQRSRAIADEAIKNGFPTDMVNSFDNSTEVAPFLVPLVGLGDVILVKGSQSIRAERVTRALLREPEKADKLLVRQEKEWVDKK